MNGFISTALTTLLLAAMCACGPHRPSTDQRPMPVAYARPNLPDTLLAAPDFAPLSFPVNASATLSSEHRGWLNVAYPTLGATVHITFTPTNADSISSVQENRMERLLLNAGDNYTDFSEFTNPAGFDIIVATSEGGLTPLQFLATDHDKWVVSGAVYFSNPEASTAIDSIKPIVGAIRNDIVRGLTSLNYK